MPYRLQIIPSALKAINKLDKKSRNAILLKIETLKINPGPHGSIKLTGEESYRIRVGNYRVIYEIEDDILRVIVTRAAHRRDVYE